MSEGRPPGVNRSSGDEVGEPLDARLEHVLREEREREIEEAYRRGYGNRVSPKRALHHYAAAM